MNARPIRAALVALAALALALGACKKSAPEEGAGAGGSGAAAEEAATSGAQAAFPASQPALAGVEGLALLPKTTLTVAVVRDPAKLLDEAGRAQIVEKLRSHYEEAVAAVTAATGHNLLDPSTWEAVGVDAHAPMGIAWLSVERENGAAFFGLTDPEKFKTFVYATGGRMGGEFETETIGDALVIYAERDEEVCLVLRGKHAVIAFADDDDDGLATARTLAKIAPAESLAERAELKAALDRLAYGADAAIWADTPAIVKAAFADLARGREGASSVTAMYDQRIAAAKESGADAAAIAQIERQRTEELAWEARWQKRREAEAELLGAVTRPFGPVAIGLELGDAAVTAKAVATVEAGSLPAGLMRPAEGGFPLVAALDEAPLYLAATRADLAAFRSFLGQTMKAEGEDIAEVEGMLKKMTGVDVEVDLLPALDGSFGFAVTGDLSITTDGIDSFLASLGGAATVGVADEAKAKALLEKIRAIPPVAALVTVDEASGDWTIAVPAWKPVHLALRGGRIVASPDRALLDRIAKGERGAWLGEKASAELKALLTMDAPAAIWATDMAGSAYWLLRAGMDYEMAEASPEDGSGAPKSEAWKKKKAELAEVEAQAKALRQQRREAENQGIGAAMRLFGTTAMVARREGDALVVYGGQYVNAEDIPTFAAGVAEAATIQMTKADELRRKLWKLDDQRWQLREELRQIRQKDVEAHQQQKAAAPPQP